MTTKWFDKVPGEPLGGIATDEECPDFSGGIELLFYDKPDWARLPDELGGGRRRILSITRDDCPCCEGETVRRYNLEGDDGLVVFGCLTHGFLWCKVSVDTDE